MPPDDPVFEAGGESLDLIVDTRTEIDVTATRRMGICPDDRAPAYATPGIKQCRFGNEHKRPLGNATSGDVMFGLADIGYPELCSWSMEELREVRLPFGMGIERIAMLKYGIPDLRTFFESDIRWLQHYGFDPLERPNPVTGST